MEKCLVYCRQSSGASSADESLSIEVQIKECLNFAEGKGLQVVGVFKEPNTSGRLYPTGYEALSQQDFIYSKWCEETRKTGHFRKELGNLLEKIQGVQYIVCYDLTRFFRPLTGSFLGNLLQQKLQFAGVKLFTIKEGVIDFSKFQDNLISMLTSQINSEQLQIQKMKVKEAFKRLREKGEYTHSLCRCHGYVSTGDKSVEKDGVYSEAIKDAYNFFLDGNSLSNTLRHINKKYAKNFEKPVHMSQVKRWLTNPIYCGYFFKDNGEMIKALQVEGKEIISFEMWKRAKERFENNVTYKTKMRKIWNPLRNFVRCGDCGGFIHYSTKPNKDFGYFHCRKHLLSGGEKCKCAYIRSSSIYEAVKPLLLTQAIKHLQMALNNDTLRKEIENEKINLENVRKKEAKLNEMWMNGDMDDEAYSAGMKKMKAVKSEIQNKIIKLEQESSSENSVEKWMNMFIRLHSENEKYKMSKDEFELLANEMLKRILIHDDRIEIQSIYGNLSIPIQKSHGITSTWNVWVDIIMDKESSFDIIYYSGKVSDIPNNWREKSEFITSLDVFKVWKFSNEAV